MATAQTSLAQVEPRHRAYEATRSSSRVQQLLELAKQAGLVGLAILLYFGVRGITEAGVDSAVRNGLNVLRFERALGIDIEHWAQSVTLNHHSLVTAGNWVYIWGHWPVIVATLIWLHQSRRLDYLQLRNAMFISGAIGLVMFASFAVAPPRLLDIGLVDTVSEFSRSYRILQPPSLVNKYAAIPSLHVGWNLLIGMSLVTVSNNKVMKTLGVLSPTIMTVAVVITANHFVIDALLGAAVALIGWAAARRITPLLMALDARLIRGERVAQTRVPSASVD